jgi:hypothetical protein
VYHEHAVRLWHGLVFPALYLLRLAQVKVFEHGVYEGYGLLLPQKPSTLPRLPFSEGLTTATAVRGDDRHRSDLAMKGDTEEPFIVRFILPEDLLYDHTCTFSQAVQPRLIEECKLLEPTT